MKRIHSILMSLMVLALLSAGAIAEKANADVRVSATLRTPGVRVHVSNSPYSNHRRVTTVQRTVVARHYYKITRHDRNVALRLSAYTGVPVRRMIRMRGAGLGWYQIGHRLHMPRRMVRAAMRPATWNRFLHRQREFARCGKTGTTRRVTYVDDGNVDFIYDDDWEYNRGWTYDD